MANAEPLPAAFDPEQEPDKFLGGIKKRASSKFSRKRQASVELGVRLAYWLLVLGKEDQAVEVCRFLGEYQFAGNFSLWSWVESALVLQSRIARKHDRLEESAECLRR